MFHWVRLKKGLTLLLFLFFSSLPSYAGSIREVSQNVAKVKSLQPPYQFAVLGDSRDGDKVYQQLLGRILLRKPDFIIHVGDMILQPGEKEWKNFFDISKEIDIPFFPVVGNHEVAGTFRVLYDFKWLQNQQIIRMILISHCFVDSIFFEFNSILF